MWYVIEPQIQNESRKTIKIDHTRFLLIRLFEFFFADETIHDENDIGNFIGKKLIDGEKYKVIKNRFISDENHKFPSRSRVIWNLNENGPSNLLGSLILRCMPVLFVDFVLFFVKKKSERDHIWVQDLW